MIIHTWRNIFFFEGLLTVLIGLGSPFLLPTCPKDCWFLTERERMIATQRLIIKNGADENEKTEPRHVKSAFTNITNYFCALGFFFINITVQGISLFMVSWYRYRAGCLANIVSPLFSKISVGPLPKRSSTLYHPTSARALLPLRSPMSRTKPTVVASTSPSSRFPQSLALRLCDGQRTLTSSMEVSS